MAKRVDYRSQGFGRCRRGCLVHTRSVHQPGDAGCAGAVRARKAVYQDPVTGGQRLLNEDMGLAVVRQYFLCTTSENGVSCTTRGVHTRGARTLCGDLPALCPSGGCTSAPLGSGSSEMWDCVRGSWGNSSLGS